MPHTIWSGVISFGLVSIPIRVTAATEDHSIKFRQCHLTDMSRVRTRKVCELEDREVTADEIGKGYQLSKDTLVTVSDDELADIPLPTARAIEIVAFVPYESIDPIRIGEGYYLEADSAAASKPYVLLQQALERNSKAAVAKFAWHGRERLGLLRVRENVIALHAMRWPDEVRDPSEIAPSAVELANEEIEEARLLIDRMGRDDLEGPEFADHYTDALADVIKAKRDGKAPPEMPAQESAPGQVVDLMEALTQSVEKTRTARGEGAETTVHGMPKKTAKKTTAKKAAAKKAAKKPRRSA